MKPHRTVPDMPIESLAMVAVSVHNAVRQMPVVVKARDSAGFLIEDGEFHVASRECDALENVFSGDHIQRIYIKGGKHNGSVMFASAIVNDMGQRLAAIGVIDTLGVLSLKEFVANNHNIDMQLHGHHPWR